MQMFVRCLKFLGLSDVCLRSVGKSETIIIHLAKNEGNNAVALCYLIFIVIEYILIDIRRCFRMTLVDQLSRHEIERCFNVDDSSHERIFSQEVEDT